MVSKWVMTYLKPFTNFLGHPSKGMDSQWLVESFADFPWTSFWSSHGRLLKTFQTCWLNDFFWKEHINQLLLIIVVAHCCWWLLLLIVVVLVVLVLIILPVLCRCCCWCYCRCCYQRNRQYPWCAREASRAEKGSSPWFLVIPYHKACYFLGETWQTGVGPLDVLSWLGGTGPFPDIQHLHPSFPKVKVRPQTMSSLPQGLVPCSLLQVDGKWLKQVGKMVQNFLMYYRWFGNPVTLFR